MGAQERRIVELRLGNVGAKGVVPVTVLAAFSAVRTINFTADPALPGAAQLQLPRGAECASIPACLDIGCDLGPTVPVCDSFGRAPTVAPVKPAIAAPGVIAAAVLGSLVVAGFLAVGTYMYVTKDARARRARKAKKQREEREYKEAKKRIRKRERRGKEPKRADVKFVQKYERQQAKRQARSGASSAGGSSLPDDEPYAPVPTPGGASSRSLGRSESRRSLSRNDSRRSLSRKQSLRRAYKPRNARAGTSADEDTWSPALDMASGATYYINNRTGQFSWTPPGGGGGAPGGGGGGSRAMTPSPAVPASRMMPPTPPPAPAANFYAPPQFAQGAFGAAPGGFGSAGAGGGFRGPAPPMPPMGFYGAPAMGGGGGQQQWEEVYDSVSDSSYWISPLTGEFSYTNPYGR